MKDDILFLCQFFYPENVSSATLPFDTAKYLSQAGFKVGALCGYPKEYVKEDHVPVRETVDGIPIRRLKYIQLGRKSTIGRLINYFSFTLTAFLHVSILKKYRTVIVFSNPPILPVVALLGKWLYKTKIVFVAYDVYPEIGYASGSIRPGSLIDRVMGRLNRALYKRVDRVVALTDEMKDYLLAHRAGLGEDTVTTIANWAHEKTLVPTADAYARFGYTPGQFVVSYFGNMGVCQDVGTMLRAANLLKEDNRIRFLIVGHGNKKAFVADYIRQNALSNVQLLDYLTGDDFEKAIAITSCCLVSLERGLKGMCAPSKYYSYLQGGHAIVAVVEEGSYLAKEVVSEKIGCHIPLGDFEELGRQLNCLCENTVACAQMGVRAKQLYVEKYEKCVAMKKYETLFRTLLS